MNDSLGARSIFNNTIRKYSYRYPDVRQSFREMRQEAIVYEDRCIVIEFCVCIDVEDCIEGLDRRIGGSIRRAGDQSHHENTNFLKIVVRTTCIPHR